MTITDELSRIQQNRDTIRAKLTSIGLADSTSNLDDCATAVNGIVNNGAVSATVKEGETYTIPKGYHNGSGSVAGVSGGGNYTLQAKTVTPTKSEQNVTSDDGYYGLSSVTVNSIPVTYQDVTSVTATAADVLANKIIVTKDGKVTTGTMKNNGAVAASINALEATSYTIPAGYHSGSGKVSLTDDLLEALRAI